MAGVPKVMNAMMDAIAPQLSGGIPVISRTIRFEGGEGDIAKPLKDIQEQFPMLSLGSYPFESERGFNTNLVLRGRDEASLTAAFEAVKAATEALVTAGKARGWSEV
jgi:molybdopterin-biosynthesis enzyme MoeA-like protein